MRNLKKRIAPRSSENRQSEILLHVKEKGAASIGEIAERFGVSEMTVRRVLHRLADGALVIRTPGAAMVAPAGSMERTFVERSEKMASAKDALGRVAAGRVWEGGRGGVGSG